jgi:hypothetical protein
MAHLGIDEAISGGVVHDVAPLVRGVVGWPLGLDTLGIRVVAKDRGYEEIVLARLYGIGIDMPEADERSLAERLLEYVIEGTVRAAYEPSTGELLVVRENVDDSNLNGLRLVVGHELVHRAQHLRHPHLFERVDETLRQLCRHASEGDLTLEHVRTAITEVRPIMSLLESHAHYVEECLRRSHFPDAVVESHFGLPALLFRMFGGAKLSQYTAAVPQVAEATKRNALDALYRSLPGPA